ncbi:type 1 glutamine amidotransferase [Paucidesulfovibrio longus]|uniref:type 1 glutamine amidotransferase n=1 Tax=Paucidesulfovibrio longus TaxID=889 RepID=UPI0003B6C73C|nr:type 1 glutamine amidotransferase [Paucidesulfovibrio longus]
MKIKTLMHVPFEGPAAIADWAAEGGHSLDETHLFDGARLPEQGEFDLLVCMGGPMGAADDEQYPFLPPERALLAETVRLGKPVLGICLGAQLLSLALGGALSRNRMPEIGVFPVQLSEKAQELELFKGFPESFDVLHWHGDTFSIPAGATLAASSVACAHQAFVHGKNAVGLQFHIEATPASLERMIEHCCDELQEADFVQSAETLRAHAPALAAMNPLLFGLLDRLAATAKQG